MSATRYYAVCAGYKRSYRQRTICVRHPTCEALLLFRTRLVDCRRSRALLALSAWLPPKGPYWSHGVDRSAALARILEFGVLKDCVGSQED